jgi:hypothetical protein
MKMKMKKIPLILFLLVLISCSNNKKVRISGSFDGSPAGEYVMLEEIRVGSSGIVDSFKIGSKGNFKFTVRIDEPQFYQLRFNNGIKLNLLAEPGDKIALSGSFENLPFEYSLNGSKGSQYMQELDQTLIKTKIRLDSIYKAYTTLMAGAEMDEKKVILENLYASAIKAQKRSTIGFIITHYNSMASVMALYQKYNDSTWVLDSPREIQYFKIVSDSLGKIYPNSNHVKALRADLNQQLANHRAMVLQSLALKTPVGFPEIDLPDQNGDTLRLSSLKGKVIILNFWVSSSPDCLMQNRGLMQLYSNYGKKGLVIYSVSLDTDRMAWLSSIKENGYPWLNVCEGRYSDSRYAALYNIQKLPSFYIIDKKGDIAGHDLNDEALDRKIAELLRK